MALSTEQAELLLPGHVWRESEFVYDPVGRRWLTGTCGPNAAAMAERWADQSRLSTLNVYHRMHAAGRCDANGSATLFSLTEDARSAGYKVDELRYREPLSEAEWRDFFMRHVGRQAIVFETANGQALVDAISRKGENARHLQYHFIMVAGWHPGGYSVRAHRGLPPGWWCADGDNFAAGNVLQFYPHTVLAAARPCAAMAIQARVIIAGTGGTTTVSYTTNADGTVTFSSGVRLGTGFSDEVLLHGVPDADSEPEGPEWYVGADEAVLQWTTGDVWVWTRATDAVYRDRAAQVVEALRADAATLTTQLQQAQQQIQQLQQLQQAQQKPPPPTDTNPSGAATPPIAVLPDATDPSTSAAHPNHAF